MKKIYKKLLAVILATALVLLMVPADIGVTKVEAADAEDIIYHLSDGFFLPKTCSGKSIFWNFASSRGDDFEREYAREPGAILSESISSFGKGFWKMLLFQDVAFPFQKDYGKLPPKNDK